MVLHDCDSNNVLADPIKNRADPEIYGPSKTYLTDA
jgi:hypothetical protein